MESINSALNFGPGGLRIANALRCVTNNKKCSGICNCQDSLSKIIRLEHLSYAAKLLLYCHPSETNCIQHISKLGYKISLVTQLREAALYNSDNVDIFCQLLNHPHISLNRTDFNNCILSYLNKTGFYRSGNGIPEKILNDPRFNANSILKRAAEKKGMLMFTMLKHGANPKQIEDIVFCETLCLHCGKSDQEDTGQLEQCLGLCCPEPNTVFYNKLIAIACKRRRLKIICHCINYYDHNLMFVEENSVKYNTLSLMLGNFSTISQSFQSLKRFCKSDEGHIFNILLSQASNHKLDVLGKVNPSLSAEMDIIFDCKLFCLFREILTRTSHNHVYNNGMIDRSKYCYINYQGVINKFNTLYKTYGSILGDFSSYYEYSLPKIRESNENAAHHALIFCIGKIGTIGDYLKSEDNELFILAMWEHFGKTLYLIREMLLPELSNYIFQILVTL